MARQLDEKRKIIKLVEPIITTCYPIMFYHNFNNALTIIRSFSCKMGLPRITPIVQEIYWVGLVDVVQSSGLLDNPILRPWIFSCGML